METDSVLAGLCAQFEQKSAEAQSIISNPASLGPALTKAEKLFNECEALQPQIDERREHVDRLNRLKGYSTANDQWSREPQRKMPFAAQMGDGSKTSYTNRGDGQFSVTGTQPAGSIEMEYSPQTKLWNMVQEAGPGTFKAKQWQAMNSFEYKLGFWQGYMRKGNRAVDSLEFKILQEGLDDQGGIFAPAEFVARIIGRLPAPTALRSLVTTLTTGRDTLVMPRKQYAADDQYTTAFRATWTGEIPSDGTGDLERVNDQNLLGNVEIPVHTAMLTAPITKNLIEDSAFPIQAWLESELAQIIDLLYEDMILNGSTGSNTAMGASKTQPIGILFGALAGNAETNYLPEVILSSTAGGIDYGSLVRTQGALAPQYEDDNATVWIMNKRSTYVGLELLVDSQNRPLFTTGYGDSGMVERRGRRLLGDRIILSQFMPNMSSTTFPIVYGDVRGYHLAQRVGFSIQILDQTKAKANQIELVGRVRFGGAPIEPFRMKILKSNNS